MKRISLCFLSLINIFYTNSQSNNDSVINLYFESNHYDITEEHKSIIESVLLNKRYRITEIKGYADSMASDSYNLALSKKRAYSVYDYLEDRNLIDIAISPKYFGENYSGSEDLNKDRKVEIGLKIFSTQLPARPDSTVVTKKFELTTIYFVPDKAIIEPWSMGAVDDVAVALKNYPGCSFEITGHVNYVLPKSLQDNPKVLEPIQKLSEERAKVVYDLLVDRGIPSQSMKYKGAGNSEMYFKNPKNDEEKRKNMRVEITVYCNQK